MNFFGVQMRSPGQLLFWLSALLIALAMGQVVDPVFLCTDAAHHITAAQNILDGRGYSTAVPYYAEQLAFGYIPSPQTVWPPLTSLLLVPLIVIGIPATWSPFVLALIFHIASGWLLIKLCLRLRLSELASYSIGIGWLFYCWPLFTVAIGLSEPMYCTFAIGSLLQLVQATEPSARVVRNLWMSAVLALLAFLSRYLGLAIIAAHGAAALAVVYARDGDRRIAKHVVLTVGFMLAGVLLIFGRNALLVGGIRGGPDAVFAFPIADILQSLRWAGMDVFGAKGPLWVTIPLSLAALLLIAPAVVRALRLCLGTLTGRLLSADAMVAINALVVSFATLGILLIISRGVNPKDLQARYLMPLVPYWATLIWKSLVELRSVDRIHWARTLAIAVGIFYLLVQLSVWSRYEDAFPWSERKHLRATLNTPYQAGTVAEFLRTNSSDSHPLMGADCQLLGAVLERPCISLPSATYTTAQYDEKATLAMVRQYCVHLIVPNRLNLDARTPYPDTNKIFFIALERGYVPRWLQPVTLTPGFTVYRVTGSDAECNSKRPTDSQ
ncbi:MAG TPA: hypothetical protein VN496_00095 [Burkholderiales bacterium]|nr:hypothetical protein [Burkholderiales bacterium]